MDVFFILTAILLFGTSDSTKGESAAKSEITWHDILALLRKDVVSDLQEEKAHSTKAHGHHIKNIVTDIMEGLHTLGLYPKKSLNLQRLISNSGRPLEKNRLSGFLYNISMYMQGAGGESSPVPDPNLSIEGGQQFWGNLLQSFLNVGESILDTPNRKEPLRPKFKIHNMFVSLRGSQHYAGILSMLQILINFLERQQNHPLFNFLWQNWDMIGTLLETIFQTLLNGSYGHGSAGLQSIFCALTGHTDCGFNLDWLQQLYRYLEARNWKPVVNFHPGIGGIGNLNGGIQSVGRFKPFSVLPEALKEEDGVNNHTEIESEHLASMPSLLLHAFSRSNEIEKSEPAIEASSVLWQGLDGLRQGLFQRMGSSVYVSLKRKVSRITRSLFDDVTTLVRIPQPDQDGKCTVGDLRQLLLWGIGNNIDWNAQMLGFASQGFPAEPPFLSCMKLGQEGSKKKQENLRKTRSIAPEPDLEDIWSGTDVTVEDNFFATSELLEAVCNESIPGLTGVSNFTVFLYCNLFEGNDDTVDMEASDPGVDLQSLCSDAAWYLSAAEADFLWVTVCSEYFATEFNSTVCSNSSFWVARAQSQVTMQKEFYSFNQTSIDNLCQQMSSGPNGSSLKSTSENCLSHLNTRVLNVQNFSRCFLPNASTLIGNLCGTETTFVPVEGSWAFEFCTKNWYNFTSLGLGTCDIRYWTPASFENATLLKHCWNNKGFRNYICHNDTIYYHLAPIHPWILGYCADPETNSGDERCFLQKIFDLLPIPYDFESSQLCQNPTPHLLEILYKLSECKGEVHELHNWIVNVNYILRLLDFIVSLPSGFDTGKREVRAQLSEAILLSSLLDNTSFYAALSSNASLSVLQAVGDFLRNERNVSLKEDLLSCFSPVLWDLIQKEDNSSSLRFLFQEYLQMPRESLRSLLMSAENEAVKRFLSHMHQTWNQLQVSQQDEQAMEMMTSALLHKFPRVTPDLFVDLSQFIPFMSVSDIMSFPSLLLVNDSVLTAIRDHSSEMKPLQKRAFVKRLLQSNVLGQVPLWPPYFLRSLQPLLPHLPLCHFQQLTAEQLIPLVETLGNSSLDTTRGRHVLRTIFGNKQNITAEIAQRLGILLCYMNPENLQALLRFQPFVKRLLWCVSEGLISPTSRRAHSLLQAVKSVNASELTSSQLASLRGILPQLGISFLNHVSMTRITDILAKPGLTDFSPAQAFLILKKIMQSKDISIPHPCQLWPLRFGLGPAFMKILQPPWTSDSSCQCWKSLLPELGLAQRAMLLETLQILRNGSEKLSPHIDCLLPFVPLKELTDDGAEIFKNIAIYKFQPWSTHQAQYLFKKILQTSNITKEVFMSLGSIARGVTCNWVRNWANHSDFGELLIFITQIPLGIHPSLKKCVIEEIQKRSEMDLQLLPPQFSIDLPLRMIETLPNSSLEAILDHISRHFSDFLRLPHYKQSVLVERASSILGVVPDQEISGMLLDLLGPLFPFLDSSRVEQVQREALLLRLDEFKGYCLPPEALLELGQLLKEAAVLGEPSGWTQMQMEHAGRLVLSLSPQEIYQLPKEASSLDIVEQILESQRDWETSKVGQNCGAIEKITEKKKSLTARFVTGTAGKGKREPIPSCSDLKGTFPAAWTTGQFLGMLEQELLDCLDMLGQDPDLSAEQRKALWDRLKQFQMYVPLRSVKPEQILQLGWIVTQLSDKELQELNLSHLEIVAYMGQFDQWTPKQMRAIVLNYLKRSGQSIEDLEMSKLVSYGFLICGLSPTEISRLDPKALSKSALFLGELNLGCSELQAEALTTRIMLSDAFGPVSEWGPEIFTEIGTLAEMKCEASESTEDQLAQGLKLQPISVQAAAYLAGLPDVVLSSLIREQFEGLTPAAIGLMPASKFAVVFSPVHLSWMTPEQARAVTPHQWAELNSEQSQAVTMAQYEGELIQEQRGKSSTMAPCEDKMLLLLSSLFCILSFLS